VLARGDRAGNLEARESQATRGWHVEVAVDFDPTVVGNYWLSHCEMFLVDTVSNERVGVVWAVGMYPGTSQPVWLEIATGWFGRQRFLVPVERVQVILPLERRLLISGIPDIPRRQRPSRRRHHAHPDRPPALTI
jgi:hypothetical protein